MELDMHGLHAESGTSSTIERRPLCHPFASFTVLGSPHRHSGFRRRPGLQECNVRTSSARPKDVVELHSKPGVTVDLTNGRHLALDRDKDGVQRLLKVPRKDQGVPRQSRFGVGSITPSLTFQRNSALTSESLSSGFCCRSVHCIHLKFSSSPLNHRAPTRDPKDPLILGAPPTS